MRTKFLDIFFLLAFVVFSGVLAAQDADGIDDGLEVPPVRVDGDEIDILGSIPNVTVDEIKKERLRKGFLMPKLGTEDYFLTTNSSMLVDLTDLGPTCLTPFQDGIIGSDRPARKGNEPIQVRKLVSGTKTGTVQVIVERDVSGVGDCSQTGELLKVLKITVTEEDILKVLQELDALVGDTEGLEIKVVGNRIVLDGKIIVPAQLVRLQSVVKSYQDNPDGVTILPLYEMSPVAYELLAEKMEEEIAGGPDRARDITVRVLNGRFFLEGSVDEFSQREKALKVCRAYLQDELVRESFGITRPEKMDEGDDLGAIKICNNSIWIRQGQPSQPDPVISIRADFVTLQKDYFKNFEFYWRPTLAADGDFNYESDAGRFTSSFVGTVRRLFPVLRAAANHGYARVLKSATVVVVDQPGAGNPTPAKITEEFVISVPGGTTPEGGQAPPTEATLSTSLEVTAKSIAGSEKIEMGITAQLTQQRGTGSGGGPNSLVNTVTTPVVVTNGVSAAIGGMIGESREVNYDRSPGAEGAGTSNFELFGVGRGQTFSDNKTQFLVFITPTKLLDPSEGTQELKRKFRLRQD